MSDGQARNGTKGQPVKGQASMDDIWDEAAEEFKKICKKALHFKEGDPKYKLRTFDDVQKRIEDAGKGVYEPEEIQKGTGKKTREVALRSLSLLKMLVGAAAEVASGIGPLPSWGVNLTTSALVFVFEIPEKIENYHEAIAQVFGEINPALARFQVYQSMHKTPSMLIERMRNAMISFVKLCAHVVKFQQSGKRKRLLTITKVAILNDNELDAEMKVFRKQLRSLDSAESTVTLSEVIAQRLDIATGFETALIKMNMLEQAQFAAYKDIRSMKEKIDRSEALTKISNELGLDGTVKLHTPNTQSYDKNRKKCHQDTGSWIWEHGCYKAWINSKDQHHSPVLLLSGPRSSGKTLATAQIVKKLQDEYGKLEDRTFVAHYFFTRSVGATKKDEDVQTSVYSALKHMAYQIAMSDSAVRDALYYECIKGGGSAFPSKGDLSVLCRALHIGNPRSGATYYLVFDGLENLSRDRAKMLLGLVYGTGQQRPWIETNGYVRMLLSGTDGQFDIKAGAPSLKSALRIRMEKNSCTDMRVIVSEALEESIDVSNMQRYAEADEELRHRVEKAKKEIIRTLPQRVEGDYSALQRGLQGVQRMMKIGALVQELHSDPSRSGSTATQPTSDEELAMRNLQNLLTLSEVKELNELLKWVIFGQGLEIRHLHQLEAIMFLYSNKKPLVSLASMVLICYPHILELEDNYVSERPGLRTYFEKQRKQTAIYFKDRATVSMTIQINNVDQELCGHFLWDLTHTAIRDRFKFDFDKASNALLSQSTISADEFDAHYTIVMRVFTYLKQTPRTEIKHIGRYFIHWLPYHLERLRELEGEGEGSLTSPQKAEIGKSLYKVLGSEKTIPPHCDSFQSSYWTPREMISLREWLKRADVVVKLDKDWQNQVFRALAAPKLVKSGILETFAKVIVNGVLRDPKRTWPVKGAHTWIENFMEADKQSIRQNSGDRTTDVDSSASGSDSDSLVESSSDISVEIHHWDRLSNWCRDLLRISNSEPDSLWFERLAAIAFENGDTIIARKYYEDALELGNPSWHCHRGLGEVLFWQGNTKEAITEIKLALGQVKNENGSPQRQSKDVVDLHLLIASGAERDNDVSLAAEHFELACKVEGVNAEQANRGKLGLLKARLKLPDVDHSTRMWFRDTSIFDQENMVRILRTFASTLNDDFEDPGVIFSQLFTVAKGEPTLERRITDALKAATAETTVDQNDAATIPRRRYSPETIECGVLLYYRGAAANMFSSISAEPMSTPQDHWIRCRELLSGIRDTNATWARSKATYELAKYYFHDMREKDHLNHVNLLIGLVDENSGSERTDASGFLGALHAIRGEKTESEKVLRPRIDYAIQMLEDDTPDNDVDALIELRRTLVQGGDFVNAAVALSLLCQPDLVTEALQFSETDLPQSHIESSGMDGQLLLDELRALSKGVIDTVKVQFPDPSQQLERIQAAQDYFRSLQNDQKALSTREDEPINADHMMTRVYSLIEERLDSLARKHLPQIDEDEYIWFMSCDGCTAAGGKCENEDGFRMAFYSCVYCARMDFCEDCLGRLRDPLRSDEMTACSPKHRWLRIPRWGSESLVGLDMAHKGAHVNIPAEVKAIDQEPTILEIIYAQDGEGQVMTLEEWRDNLMKRWKVGSQRVEPANCSKDESDV